MAAASITDQVDNHVLVKRHPVIDRQLHRKNSRFRIVSIDMKYRRSNHFGNFAAIFRRPSVVDAMCRETDLIVDDKVYGSTTIKTAGLRHLKCFHDHSLTRERCVAMDQ